MPALGIKGSFGRFQIDLENPCSQTWNKVAKNGPNPCCCVLRAPNPNARDLSAEFGASRLWSRAQLKFHFHSHLSVHQSSPWRILNSALPSGELSRAGSVPLQSAVAGDDTGSVKTPVLLPHLPFLWGSALYPTGNEPQASSEHVGCHTEAHLTRGTLS